MLRAKVTTKGQVTIPKALRDKLGLKPGDYVIVNETSEGYILEKEVDERRFDKYVGLLSLKQESDQIIEELRGK